MGGQCGVLWRGKCWENLKERDYVEYPIVSMRIILRWLLQKCNRKCKWVKPNERVVKCK